MLNSFLGWLVVADVLLSTIFYIKGDIPTATYGMLSALFLEYYRRQP